MNIWLKEIDVNDGMNYFNLLNELASYPDVYAKPIPEPMEFEEFDEFKKVRISLSLGENQKIGFVNTYWVMDGEQPIGYATLKHEVDLNKVGGNFGLCLKKEFQNKGIGTIVSSLLSKIAYEDLGIEEVIYTSKKENIQSQKSLENIGAEFLFEKDGYYFYKVNLKEKLEKGERK